MKRLVGFLALCLLSACAGTHDAESVDSNKAKDTESEESTSDQPLPRHVTIGRISSVNAAEKFVLIQQMSSLNLTAGTTLTSFGQSGDRANLLVSGEKMGLFAVADVRTGDVAVGDTVQWLPPSDEPVDPFPGAIQLGEKPEKSVPTEPTPGAEDPVLQPAS